ncbi:MAG: c-type cytochrome domain-containing protein [Vicingaceae bacterium]
MKKISGLTLVFSLCAVLTMCKHDAIEPPVGSILPPVDTNDTDTITGKPCDPDTVYFERDVLPLLQGSCAKSGCHDAITRTEGIVLDSYANVIGSGIIKLNDPAGSDIYERITETDQSKIMPPPPNPKLNADQAALILKWIQQGALNLFCDGCDTFNTFYGELALLMFNACASCHNDNSTYPTLLSKNLSFFPSAPTSGNDIYYNQLIAISNDSVNGKNRLIGSMTWESEFVNMPYGSSTAPSDCDVSIIKDWIAAGRPN